ncbi:PREDICTED: uncharacterized protein LOC109484986 [Branchiostoma belcheri]|uniref:Uncharacterized protein LOC109484986 n=1 Tax=Branchiostoma belcheri TaxID=7741 RepID=A0A6P5ACC2_BRABE|nr:PREDICTED: uncharacterized protein LOC109484986 [Branchiostoma belcheri]
MSEEVGVTDADTEGAMPGLEVPNWCEGCAGCLALRKELQDKEAEHKRVWLAVKQRVISTEHCETLQMQLDSALKEMEPLKKRNRELEKSQEKCRAEVEEARDRIRASEGLCQQYREVIKKFEDEEAAREANNSSEKKVSVAKLQEDLAKLKADLTSEKRKSRGLERELDRAKVMIEGLQEQNSRVQQEAGEPASIPVVTPAKQPRTSHVTHTRTPKQKAPSPISAMSCSNTANETSDEEEEVNWSTVPNRGVLSPVRLLSPLSPLPPTPAPCRRDDRFSSSSDSSDDNSDMDDDADRIESELLGGTQSLPFSDTDIADEKANEPPKLSPVRSNYRNGIHRSPVLKQSPTVNVSKENGKAQVKRFPRDRVNCSSTQKLTRSQDRRGQKRPPLRRAAKAKAAPMEEEITPPIESTKAAVENDCRSWFGEVEDLSDSESDSCLEKEKDREIKAKNGGEDFASPPRMARLCSSATTESNNDTTEEKRKTRAKSEVLISPLKKTKTTGVTPSRYPLRSRSGDSKQEQEQNGDASFSPRKKNKSESDADDIGGKVNSPTRSQYELRSRQDNKTDKKDDRIEAENTKDKTNVVNESNETLQEQTATKDLHEKEEKPVDSRKLSNSLTEEESDKDEAVKPQSQEENKMSSGFDEVCNNSVENNTTDSESNSKISSPPHVDLPAAPSVNKDPSNNAKAESDQEGTEKPRPDSPEFRRPLTRSLSHGGKVNPGSRRDSSSSEREGDVSPRRVARLKTKLVSPVAGPSSITRSRSSSSEKSHSDVDTKDNLFNPPNSNPTKRATRLQTKLVSPVAGPSLRTRSRSSSSEKSLSDVDMKDKPCNSNTPKRVTRLQTKLISPVAGPSSRRRNRSSSSEKNLSDVDTKDSPPTKKATRLQTKLISPVAGHSSRTQNRSSSSEKSPLDVDTKDNPPKRAARLQSKLVAGPSSRTRSRSLSSEKSLSDVDTKDNPTNPSNSNTPKRVTRLQTKLISPLSGPSSRTRKRSLSSEKGLSDVDTKDNRPKVDSPRRSMRKSDMASLSSSEQMTNRDAEKSAPKSVLSPNKSAKHLRTEDTSGNIHLQVNVSDKETCTAQRNVTSALDIAPQMVTEKPVPKAEPLNNSTSQISKEDAIVKSPKVCTTSEARKMLAVNKVAVVVLEPLEKVSQQSTALQKHVPQEHQNGRHNGKSCTMEAAATNNNATIDEHTINTPEVPDETNRKGSTCTNDNANQQVHQEVGAKADELPSGARQSSAKDGANQEAPKEEETACDTMEEGELSESETETTVSLPNSAASAREHQPMELCLRQQPGVSLPDRESPRVSNRSNRSSLSTSPVSPLPPSPFESLALSPLPVSPLLLERPISPLPPSPWGRSASPSLSPSLPISPLRETPLPPVVSPLQRTPHGDDGWSQSVSSKDAASPNAENPAHSSPCVFRSVAPKGAVQVKPKANRGRGAARSLSMGGKDASCQNSLNSSSKKRAILFVQSEKTAWRSGKKNTQAAQDKQKSTTKANSRPTTLPIKPNSKQQPKTKPGKGTNAQNGPEKVNEGATCSHNGHDITEETTTTPDKSSRQTLKQTEKEKIKKGQSLTLEDEDKDKQTSEMSRLKEVDPQEKIEEGKTKESSQVPDSETLSAAEDAVSSKDVSCISGTCTSKRSLEEDVEDGEITGDESDEVVERRTVKKLRTEPRDKLTADHVLQYMNNMQGGATAAGAVDIIMEYLLQSEEARVDLFPKVKTMCETHNTKLPVMTTAEMAILGRVTYLAKFGQWEGLVSQVSRALYTEIRLNIRKEHLLATCRLYTGLCRLRGQLEQVRILVYDILREKLFFPVDRILTIVSVWPLVLQRSGPNLEDGPMSHVIELVVMSQHIAEDLKSCFRSLYQWKDVKDGDVNSMADRLVELLQRKETAALVNNTHRVKYPRLNPLMYETAKALELLGSHQGWKWTHDHLIQTLLLPLLQKWRDNKKAKSIKSTVPQGTVVAIMQVIGCVGRIGLAEDKLSINQLQQVMIDLLNEAVKKPNSVPWGIQIAAASSLVQLSPGNPGHALSALQTWMNLPRPTLPECMVVLLTVNDPVFRMGYRESIKTPVNSPESRRSFQCSHRVPESCRILPRRQVAVFRGTLQQANAEDIVQKMKPRTSLMKPNFSEEKRTSRSKEDHTSSQTSTKDEIMRGTTAVCDRTERNGYKQTVKNNVDASRKSASTSATRSLKTEHVRRQAQHISSPTTHRQAPSSHHGKHRGKTLSTTRSAPAAGRSSWRTQLPQLFLLYERQLCVSYRPSAVPPPVPEPVIPVVPSNSSSSSRRMRRYSTGRRMSVASTATCSAFDQSIRPQHAHGKPRQQRPKARRLSLHSADGRKDADRGNMGTWAVRRFLRRSLPDEILEDHEAQDEAMLEKLPFVTTLQDITKPSKKATRRNSVVLNAYAAVQK